MMMKMMMKMSSRRLVLIFLSCCLCTPPVSPQASGNDISGFSLSPPYFNLAEGSTISATATCGEDQNQRPRSDLYCKLVGGPTIGVPSQTIQGQFCDHCNANEPDKAHPVTNAIDGTERWWQSPPLSRSLNYNQVNVTLDLGQLFHVAYIIIKFANSPRPDLWVLERSVDRGRTFMPWQYFAHSKRDCIEKFGKQPNGRVYQDDDQICTTEYSRILPLENGEIVVSLVNGRPGSKNFTYSPILQNFTKATNIRLHFLRTNTLLGHLISKAQRDPTVTRRYYYSIKDISVGGRCVCHGHAQVCGRNAPGRPNQLHCECQHNTCGESCDHCCPGFHQKPWRPATANSPNECEPCQCHSHASDCYYDPEVERRRASLNIYGRYEGGGVCKNCQHNTAGVNCEICAVGFYRPHGVPRESRTGCIPCRCDNRLTAGCEMGSGRCVCKPQYSGENCGRCANGYYGYPQCIAYPVFSTTTKSQAGNIFDPNCPVGYYGAPRCQPCDCERTGTVPEVCSSSGQCLCRTEFTGQRCDRCAPGYHNYPYCQTCGCKGPGVYDRSCGPGGQCRCLPNFAGRQCEHCASGYHSYPACRPCQCSREGSRDQTCDPRTGQCVCRPGVTGQKCDRCVAEDQRFPYCFACGCDGPGVSDRSCGPGGQCRCLPNFAGRQCEHCASGYHSYPACRPCQCSREGSRDQTCDPKTGQCVCRPGVTGQKCDRCFARDQSFPYCTECGCDGPGVSDRSCGPGGQCRCLPNFAGRQCEHCASGYHSYPACRPCQCSLEGSVEEICDLNSGQCICRPGVTGQRCDRCVEEDLSFPYCFADSHSCNPAGSEISERDPTTDACICLPYVEGDECEHCKPLYWNLARENPTGCVECMCDVKGTQSGVGECQEDDGECFCKPNICNHACDTCKDGYYLLQKRNYFGCQGCQCDVGGALGSDCDESTGQCKCRKHMRGRTCSEPEQNFYLPSLHHLKFEVENGITPNSRPVRFGYDQQEFPQFSWRGYAMLTAAQPEVLLYVVVGSSGLFSIIMRYVTAGQQGVRGRLLLLPGNTFYSHCDWSGDSKEMIFPASRSPEFLTVPGDGFAQPFTLTAGKWMVCLQAEGVLLDYLVLLPSDYYEAPILQYDITQPCTYQSQSGNCLLYKHLPMDGFPSASATQGLQSVLSRVKIRQLTINHPQMAFITGRQAQLRLTLHVPESGSHVLVLEYASEVENIQNVNVFIGGQQMDQDQTRANIYSCAYSFLCRSVVVDGYNRIAHFLLPPKAEVVLQASTASFLLYRVYAVPSAEYLMELVQPELLCVSVHGLFTDDSKHCVQSQFFTPSSAIILDSSSVTSPASPPTSARCNGLLLKYPQTEVEVSVQVSQAGRYVFGVQFCQPEHPSFSVDVLLGNTWTGQMKAQFCPAVSGCRAVVIADRRISLDISQQQTLTITLKIPRGRTLTLDYILVVPEDEYTPDLLKAKALDKASDFISQCGSQAFYINSSSSELCQSSALSLVSRYHDGALPCDCDSLGSTHSTCQPMGGQCPCRPHVIGRQCTRCATGFYGFPYCRPCVCGRRLCDEVTGECICPPQTLRPACVQCRSRTFSYHPLLGCEECDCLPSGLTNTDMGQCDIITGQCSCKPRIGGRRCSRCVAGYYGYPECLRCSCNEGGVTAQICDPDNGQCLCKRNVEGSRCDRCRRGSFNFSPSNPHGCSECFCFGATDQCRGSDKRRRKFVDMSSWRLVMSDGEEVSSVLNTLSNTVVADVQELPVSVQQLYWILPDSYLQDRVSSYGGFLTYQLKSFGLPAEGMTLLPTQPDVLLKGEKMTLVYQDPQVPSPDRLYQGRVQLVEGNFRHSGSSRRVSREELMRVLARLQGVWIRALYFRQTERLSVGEVGLEEASVSGTGAPASSVELCTCPPQYTGDSCQRCAPGYYRDSSERCVPCACNGLSDQCEESSGRCQNCRDNTAGDHCERCKDGYYGSAALRTCKICPCPLRLATNNFAVGCTEVAGRFQCLCKLGYSGERCERCAPGYYGDPEMLGGRCRPCNCNGNSCSPKTGVCDNGQHHQDTNTDEECQECDNCAQTLLNDLNGLEDELIRIKAQLDKVNSSSSLYERMKKLEEAITHTKNVVNDYNAAVDRLSPKVTALERDTLSLSEDIKLLKQKAENRSRAAQTAAANIEKTQQRAVDLNRQTVELLKKIQDLLKQLQDTEWSSGTDSADVGKLVAEAERLVKLMREKNLQPQKDAAQEELQEAQKLLDYIKNNCSKQLEQNQESARRIQGLLSDYEAKLKELEEALKQAKGAVQDANNQNSQNNNTLSDLLDKIKKLNKEKENVSNDITMAKRQLNATEDLLKMLSDSKKEYEELAAELDGAKTDLTKKVNSISPASSKEALVKKAEDHAALLNKLANELQNAVQNSSGRADVQNALAAIDAYKNITEAVKAAEEAAKKAKEAADKALKDVIDGDVTNRAKDLKDDGNKLLKDARNAANDLKQATDELNNQQQRLEEAGKKKDALEKVLAAINTDLSGINRDNIGKIIDAAKKTAAAANASATDTLNQLNTINQEVQKIKTTPSSSNIDQLLNDVDKTVKNLSSSVPSLLEKISEVEKLSSQVDPNNNISNNIQRIKELIEQARAAANRIVVPMKFTGDGYVELRPPRDLEDLRAYTALSLLLQRPNYTSRGDFRRKRRQSTVNQDLFVLYLGNRDASTDYLGMALRNNILTFVYKLNGEVYEMSTDSITPSISEPSYFDRVDIHRIYQDVEVKLTKGFTSTNPPDAQIYTQAGAPLLNLLNLNHKDVVFYVGGYPDDFTPPPALRFPKYQGCIEFSSLNEKFISLYNFKSIKPENITSKRPCKRYVPPTPDYFEGSGYAKVQLDRVQSVLVLVQKFNSPAENAVLLYITHQDVFYCLTLEKGYMVMRGRVANQVLEPKFSSTKHTLVGELKVILNSGSAGAGASSIIVRMTNKEVFTFPYTPQPFTSYYIGGLPTELRHRDNITVIPLKGCVEGVTAGGRSPTMLERVGVGRGCYPDLLTIRKAEFSKTGALEAPPTGLDFSKDVSLSVGFRNTEKDGLLFQNRQTASSLQLDMLDGHVMLTFGNSVWKSKKQYQDGEWHYLTVVKTGQRVEFRVDEYDVGETVSGSGLSGLSDNIVLGGGRFTGCLSNLYMRRPDSLYRAEDLSRFSSTGDVYLDVCNTARPPENMLANNHTIFQKKKEEARFDEASHCFIPSFIPHSLHLSGASSSLSYSINPSTLSDRPSFSLDVRTRSAEGLLFYIPAEQQNYHMTLYMSRGRIRLSIGHQREIFNREKYNDGKWHTVTLSLEKRRFYLVIDGLRAKDGVLNPREHTSIQLSSTIYLGTPPPSIQEDLKGKMPDQGVVGCIRQFKMNGSLLAGSVLVSRGVGPCFEGQTEGGAYFSGRGTYVIIDEAFMVGQRFELVFELRPTKQTGLLLHAGKHQHLTVFMRRGEVVALVNNGAGLFSVKVQPKQSLCDGQFHRIAVIQRNNVVEMHVDTEGSYTIGPSSTNPAQETHTLYVGGVPDHLKLSLPVSESYVGCLQNIVINGDVIVLEKLSGVFGPVNLKECPVNLRPPNNKNKAKL